MVMRYARLSLTLSLQASEEAEQKAIDPINDLKKPLYNPFFERYLLDEVKALRSELQAQLESSDRAISTVISNVQVPLCDHT